MSLSRYTFELLSYLEKEGKKVYSIRELSDTLCISGSVIRKELDEGKEKGWILFNESGETSLSDKGLEALEPYRVKRAIILAAGFGSRMMPATADRPKPLVKVNGVRIIDTLINALTAVGIKDIYIVRGYRKEAFDELQKDHPYVTLIDNDIYDKTNNISSMMLALDLFNGCYLCEADLYITNPNIITKYQYASNILGSYSLETDDWSFRMKDGYISDYQKGNTYCHNYYGISYWTKEDAEKLRKDFKDIYENYEGGSDVFWEFVPLVLKKDDYKVEIRPCQKQDIMEIDNYYELQELDPSYE